MKGRGIPRKKEIERERKKKGRKRQSERERERERGILIEQRKRERLPDIKTDKVIDMEASNKQKIILYCSILGYPYNTQFNIFPNIDKYIPFLTHTNIFYPSVDTMVLLLDGNSGYVAHA